METDGLFSSTVTLLGRALDLRSVRHNLIISNVANMNTPNYKRFDVMVEEELQRANGKGKGISLQATGPGHYSGKNGGANNAPRVEVTEKSEGPDGNSVDIDREMANLSENQLLFNAMSQILGKKFQGLKNVIHDGRK
jgi:flagellar basal-body rod protein FlgB